MNKVAKTAPKKAGGRPSKYRPEFAEQARKLALLGMTDTEMAGFFEVAERTFNDWKQSHPEFLQSLKKGKDLADADVTERLYRRAMGYSHEEDDIKAVNGQIVITPTIKHYPPDTTAGIFWLKNRQRGKWRDKIDTEVTGKDGESLQQSAPVINLTLNK